MASWNTLKIRTLEADVGVAARGQRAAKQFRYSIDLWNQYEVVHAGLDTIINMSEGWYNGSRIIVGNTTRIYTLL